MSGDAVELLVDEMSDHFVRESYPAERNFDDGRWNDPSKPTHRCTGCTWAGDSERDGNRHIAEAAIPIILAAERERIAQAIEASSQCSCRDAYCAQRAAAKRHARIARNSP